MKNIVLQTILITFQRMKPRFVMLACVLGLALVSAVSAAKIAQEYFGQGDFKLNVALAVLDSSDEIDFLVEVVCNTKELQRYYNITRAETQQAGQTLVQQGKVYACIVLPEGFMQGIYTGQNVAPTVLINNTDTVDAKVLSALVDTLVQMMQLTQSGIYTATDVVRAAKAMDDAFYLQSNMAYVLPVMARAALFENQDLPYVQVLEVGTHYALCIALYLLCLSTALFYPFLNHKRDFLLLKLLRSVSCHHQTFYFAQLGVLAAVYGAVFALFLWQMGAVFSWQGVLACCNALLLFLLVQALLFQWVGQSLSAMFLNFVLHTVGLVAIGGVLPTLFLPAFVSKLALLCPLYYLRVLCAGAFVSVPMFGAINLGVLFANVLLAVMVYKSNEYWVGRAERDADVL